ILPAQPPKSRRSAGTRNDTLRMCNWSGRICSANRHSKPMMVSKASEPQIRTAIVSFVVCATPVATWKSVIKSHHPVACDADPCGAEHQGARNTPFTMGRQFLRCVPMRWQEHTAQHRLVCGIRQGQLHGRHRYRDGRTVLEHERKLVFVT